ncbi:MAG: hypothetical protein AABM33_05885 [Pseudomonadota bacterium]
MVALRVTGFSGVVPRRGARLLEPNQAQVAVNCRLTSGYVGPLKQPKAVYTPVVAGIMSIFRMTDGVSDYWQAWAKDVDAVKGPIAGDITYRTYYTGDNEPRVTNIALATVGVPYPKTFFVLGVFPPSTAPTVVPSGGGAPAETRGYVYTFVTPWGEESQPSPVSALATGNTNGNWDLSLMDTAPLNTFAATGGAWAAGIATLNIASTRGLRVGETVNVSGVNPSGYNGNGLKLTAVAAGSISYALAVNPGAWVAGGVIDRVAPHNTAGMTKRIYRTVTDAAGNTTYRFVAEIAVATTVYNDVLVATGEAITTTDWAQPPTDMIGLLSLPNGMMAGFHLNELCFCEPYKPYAWPVKYRLATDFDIVGIGAFLTTVVVGTKGIPYVCSGTDPAAMILSRVDQPWPCMAKRSVVNMGFGVAYSSPQGLALIGSGGAVLVTKDLYTQEEWALLIPSSFVGAQYAGRYVASFDAGANSRQVVIIDKSEFASVVTANSKVAAMWGDPATGKLYVVVDNIIYEWDADAGLKMTADWLSREWVFPQPTNLGAAKVDADFTQTSDEIAAAQAASDAQRALNAALIAALATAGSINAYSVNGLSINGSKVKALPPVNWDSLTFQIYVNGLLKFSKALLDSKAFRLPAGYKADTAAFRVSGNITVKAIVVADTMKALATA